jgi:hypothetical protein
VTIQICDISQSFVSAIKYENISKTKKFNLIFVQKILYEPLPFIRALIKGTRSFVARALKNALMREHRLPALGS